MPRIIPSPRTAYIAAVAHAPADHALAITAGDKA